MITFTVDWLVWDRLWYYAILYVVQLDALRGTDRSLIHEPCRMAYTLMKVKYSALLYFRTVEEDKLWGRLTIVSPAPCKNYWLYNSAVVCTFSTVNRTNCLSWWRFLFSRRGSAGSTHFPLHSCGACPRYLAVVGPHVFRMNFKPLMIGFFLLSHRIETASRVLSAS